jgi:AhpC/TSA family
VCNLRYRPSSAGLGTVELIPTEARVAETTLAVGAGAPDFTAPDQNGQMWHLAEALQQSAQVLVFYRGDW